MYDNNLTWQTQKSQHFIYKYLPKTKIEKDLEDIIHNRELAYQKITTLLNVEADRPLTLYFSPSREYCQANKMLAQAAVPHEYFASLVYDDYPFSTERIRFGHEIVHLLVWFWDKQIYHLEFLEEGLATVLDLSGANYHLDYLNKLKYQLSQNFIDFSLKVKPYSRATDYEKAASFVKFLIDHFGMEKFKELYLTTSMERKDRIFYVNKKVLPANFLQVKLKQVYHQDYKTIQRRWLEALGFKL